MRMMGRECMGDGEDGGEGVGDGEDGGEGGEMVKMMRR